MILVDPAATWTVSDGDVISKAGWSPYSGRTFRGSVVPPTWVGSRSPVTGFVMMTVEAVFSTQGLLDED